MKEIIHFLNKFIDFVESMIFEDEEENEGRLLYFEFEETKKRIMRRNKREILETKLIPFVISTVLKNEKFLMSEAQARKIAEDFFEEGKRLGQIDELNRLVQNESRE